MVGIKDNVGGFDEWGDGGGVRGVLKKDEEGGGIGEKGGVVGDGVGDRGDGKLREGVVNVVGGWMLVEGKRRFGDGEVGGREMGGRGEEVREDGGVRVKGILGRVRGRDFGGIGVEVIDIFVSGFVGVVG